MTSEHNGRRPRMQSSFERELGRELNDAAHRLHGATQTSGGRRRAGLRVAVALAVMAIVLPAALLVAGRRPADAQPFRFVYSEDSLTIEVVDVVDDPDAALRQLAERGIDGEFFRVPVPPSLVDHLVMLEASPQPLRTQLRDGRIHSITVPSNYAGDLRLGLGRQAEPEESYESTAAHPRCTEFIHRPVSEVGPVIQRLAKRIRWEQLDDTGRLMTRTSEPPRDGVIADILPLSADELLVTVTPQPGLFAHAC